MVSAEDTRVGLQGVWEPDADLGPGLPAGSNHRIYLADGLYINPFRNVALIGFWSATADVLTMTPFDIRQLATGARAPELKNVFELIAWDKPATTQITWLTPDRFQETSRPEAQRRAQPVHVVTATLATGSNGAGSLGVGLAPVGAVVTQVQAGSPAERAGLQIGDWIEAVNGSNIQDGADLVKTMQALAPGSDAVLTVVRNGERIEQRVTIGALP
jgi:membrane-associated protease RseP (regulator of RpoE activity)